MTVTNEGGFPLTGLEAKDFEVLETEVSRDIVEVLGDEDGREIFLLVDTSVGFRGEIPSLRKGLQAFAASLREPHEIMLVEFGGRPKHLAGPTSDRYHLDRAAKKVIARPEGAHLADAIADVTSGITAAKQSETEPPMIVIVASLSSDFSTRRFTEAYNLAIQSPSRVLCVCDTKAIFEAPSIPRKWRNFCGVSANEVAVATRGSCPPVHWRRR